MAAVTVTATVVVQVRRVGDSGDVIWSVAGGVSDGGGGGGGGGGNKGPTQLLAPSLHLFTPEPSAPTPEASRSNS